MDARSEPSRPMIGLTAPLLPAELAIVIPVFNEAANVPLLVDAVAKALTDIAWEMVFVDDDFPDGTASEVRALAMQDARVRIVHRFGRRGLSSASVEGILATAAPIVAVMDGDLQHDERLLAAMFDRIKEGDWTWSSAAGFGGQPGLQSQEAGPERVGHEAARRWSGRR